MSLVIIRCKNCRTQLGSLDAMPDDWTGNLTVLRCRKCVIPSPRRLIHVLRSQRARGFALAVNVPLTELQSHAVKAKATGRAVTVALPPFSAAIMDPDVTS